MTQTTQQGRWLCAGDGSISVVQPYGSIVIPGSHPLAEPVFRACEEGELDLAYKLSHLDFAVKWWSDGELVVRDNQLYCRGRPVDAIARRMMLELLQKGYPAGAAIAGLQAAAEEAERLGSRVRFQYHLDPDQALVSYIGWPAFLRRHGYKVRDSRENVVEGTREMLCECAKTGRVVLLATCRTGDVVALPVATEVETCHEAQRWLAGAGVLPFPVPNSLGRS